MKIFPRILICFLLLPFFNSAGKLDSLYKELDKHKGNDTMEANIKYRIAFLHRYNDPEKAVQILREVISVTEKHRKTELHYRSFNLTGLCFKMMGKMDSALFYLNRAYEKASKNNDKNGMAMVCLNRSNVYLNQGNNTEALNQLRIAEKLYISSNDRSGLASVYNNMGLLFEDIKDLKSARAYHNKSLGVALLINDSESVSRSYSNIARLIDDAQQYDSAYYYYAKALAIDEAVGDKHGQSVILLNVGASYSNREMYREAKSWFERALKLKLELNDAKGTSMVYGNLSNVYFEEGNTEKAIEFGELALKYAEENDLVYPLMDALEYLAKFHEKKKNFEKAFSYHKRLKIISDSIFNSDTQDQIIEMQNKYEAEKKDAEIKNLNKSSELQNDIIKKQKTIQYFIFAGAALAIAFGIVVLIGYRNKKKANKVLTQQKEEISRQRDLIDSQKTIVEEKNKEITDSILYAKRIQSALLTSRNYIEKHVPGSFFIFYRPKDIVSGDFYWALSHHDKFYLVTADCTGHGVPGAFMSMMNINFLNEVIIEHGLRNTDEILNRLRSEVIRALNPESASKTVTENDAEMKDGMDCIICCFDFKNSKLQFSLANNPLWIARGNEMMEFKPDKMPVGKSPREHEPFTRHEVSLEKGDIVYAFTDGFADQFGGPKGKKFRYKPMLELLLSIKDRSLDQQQNELEKAFMNWKGNYDQIDDVLITGIKI